MTAPWRAAASCTGPKDRPNPGRFHFPDAERPGYALCSVDLRRAAFEDGGALDRCRRCLAALERARDGQISTDEAGHLLGVSRSEVRRRILRGDLVAADGLPPSETGAYRLDRAAVLALRRGGAGEGTGR